MGVELLGDPSVEAEVEALQAIGNYLKACGLEKLTLSLGHVAIVDELLNKYGESYRLAILEKNFSLLSSVEPLRDLCLPTEALSCLIL